jgi:hypothetical protein
MKNLFLTCAMFLVFGSAVAIAQEVPRKSTTTSDTIGKKKTTKGTKKNSSTYKTDTIHNKHRTDKTNKTKTTNPTTTNPTTTTRRDSIGTTRP